MSKYFSEIALNSPSHISITVRPETGVELDSVIVSRRLGKPKRQHAILVEFRVKPSAELEAMPLQTNIPWKEGDPLQVEVSVTEIYESESPRIFGLKHTKRGGLTLEAKDHSTNHKERKTKTRGLTPIGEGKPKHSLRRTKPIIDDE